MRQARGMSLKDLSAAMKERGHQLHVTQIAKSETGARPIRVNEAVAFAAALGFQLGQVLDVGTPAADRAEAERQLEELKRTETTLNAQIKQLGRGLDDLRRQTDEQEYSRRVLEAARTDVQLQMAAVRRSLTGDGGGHADG